MGWGKRMFWRVGMGLSRKEMAACKRGHYRGRETALMGMEAAMASIGPYERGTRRVGKGQEAGCWVGK